MGKKVVFITGAASGIGKATTELLLKRGFIVYGGDIQIERMNEEISHENFHPIKVDVSYDDDVIKGINEIISNEGEIDYLFANAGYCLLGPTELQDTQDVINQFNVNVFGVGRVITAALPHMRRAGGGRIVITSSAAGRVALPCMSWYPSTKYALEGIADSLRIELADFNIKVSVIEPGYVSTNIANASFPSLDKAERHPEAHVYASEMKTFRSKWGDATKNGASPDTIARAVLHAFSSRRPKRRYHPNWDAKALVFIKRFVGFWLLDRIIPKVTIK